MSKRIAFLPTPCDPFVDLLWFDNWKTWRHKVDELHVYLNGDTERPVAEYVERVFRSDPKVKLSYCPHMVQHGTALKELTRDNHENDSILFMEDDAYIIKPEIVEEYFSHIESGAVGLIGSERTSSSMDLQKIAAKRFNVDLSRAGDVGVGFWPNFFFIKRAYLLETDLDFNAHQWMQGEYIAPLDWHVQADNGVDIRADTFVWGSIQLRKIMRDRGLAIKTVPQYHLHPYWESEMREKVNIFSPEAYWMHVGSLSGGIYGHLVGADGHPLAFRGLKREPLPAGWTISSQANSEGEKLEHQKRIAFYCIALERHAEEGMRHFPEFTEEYVEAVKRVANAWKLNAVDITKQQRAYMSLLPLR